MAAALVGELPFFGDDAIVVVVVTFDGDFGRFIKSSFCKIKPLFDLTGDLSSFMGDLISFSCCCAIFTTADVAAAVAECDGDVDVDDEEEEDELDVDKSDEGFLRHTSRCRSIEPGNVRGGTRLCGNGPG